MARKGFFRRIADTVFGTPKRSAPPPPTPQTPPPAPPQPPAPPEQEGVFGGAPFDIKRAVKLQKTAYWEDVVNYSRRQSDRYVDESDEIQKMSEILRPENLSDETWSNLASLASKAHITQMRTGSAGELEIFLPFSFLWYHYLPGELCTPCTVKSKSIVISRGECSMKDNSSESTVKVWAGGILTVTYSSGSDKNKSRTVAVSDGKTALSFCIASTPSSPNLFSQVFSSIMTSLRSSRPFRRIAPESSSQRPESPPGNVEIPEGILSRFLSGIKDGSLTFSPEDGCNCGLHAPYAEIFADLSANIHGLDGCMSVTPADSGKPHS